MPDNLSEFLTGGKTWATLRTSVPGVFVSNLPAATASPTHLLVELNPLDKSRKPQKRRDQIAKSNDKRENVKKLIQHDPLPPLPNTIHSGTPTAEATRRMNGEVFEL